MLLDGLLLTGQPISRTVSRAIMHHGQMTHIRVLKLVSYVVGSNTSAVDFVQGYTIMQFIMRQHIALGSIIGCHAVFD